MFQAGLIEVFSRVHLQAIYLTHHAAVRILRGSDGYQLQTRVNCISCNDAGRFHGFCLEVLPL